MELSAINQDCPDPKEPLPLVLVMWLFFFGLMFVINWFTQRDGLKLAEGREMRLPFFALCAYYFVFYVFMARQGMGKNILNKDLLAQHGDKKKVKDWSRAVDRVFENTQEQSAAFLGSFILYSIFVKPVVGGALAIAYTVILILYLPFYGKPLMLASTVPRYLIILFFVTGGVVAAIRS